MIKSDMIAITTEKLQELILIHSYIYYHLNDRIIEDYVWDMLANELLIRKDVTKYSHLFEDFDGKTGFNLKVPEDLKLKAKELLNFVGGN